jgi:hypothetical protein
MSDGIMEPPPAEDDLDRALRELTEGTAGEPRFKELSAEERAKAARRQSRKRARTRTRPTPPPSAGWRGGYRYDLPARELRRQGRRARRRRALKATAWTLAIVVLAGAGVFAYQHFARTPGGPDDTQVVTNGAIGSSGGASSPLSEADSGPPADPFSSPANHWADGAAGVVVPTAEAVGPFSATQVAKAYQWTRKMLIAQNLDHTTLLGGAPTAFANLLVPGERSQFINGLDKIGRGKDGNDLGTRDWVTSFAPGTTALIGEVIKVHGTMTARATTDDGDSVLRIDVNYRFVYPVEPPHAPQDWVRVVAEVDENVEFGNWQGATGSFEPWVSAGGGDADVRCDSVDGFLHPDYPSGSADKVQPSGPAVDPYSLQDQPADNCQNTTGT